MLLCTNCNHVEPAINRPEHCPVCGADAEKLSRELKMEHREGALKSALL